MTTKKEGGEDIYFPDHVAKESIANDQKDDTDENHGRQPGGKVPGKERGPKGKIKRPKLRCLLCTLREILKAKNDTLIPMRNAMGPLSRGIGRRRMKKTPTLFIHRVLQRTFSDELM
jgi:hypothetical protein